MRLQIIDTATKKRVNASEILTFTEVTPPIAPQTITNATSLIVDVKAILTPGGHSLLTAKHPNVKATK